MAGLDSARLVARALGRSWRQRPARMASAIAAGIGGVLLTTAMLLVSVSVLDAIKGASISGIRPDVVAVEARAPGGMDSSLMDRAEQQTGAEGSRSVVLSTTAQTSAGSDNEPVVLFGVDESLAGFVDDQLAEEVGGTPLGADEVFLSETWAGDHGVREGDTVRISSPQGVQTWRVAGLLSGDVANRGSVVIAPLPTVAAAFDRGDTADVLLLDPGNGDRDTVAAEAEAAVDGAADVKHPEDLLSGYSKTFQTSVTILALFAVIAVLTAAVVLFLTWRLALDDARSTLARMRLFGVRTRHLMLGSAAVMVPLLLGTYVVGAALGVWVGTLLSSFTEQITNLTGQAVTPGVPWQVPVAGAFAAAVVMFAVAWLSGVRRFTAITAIEAVTGRDRIALMPGGTRRPLVAGLVTIAIGVLLVAFGGEMVRSASLLFLLGGAALLCVVLPVVVGALLRRGEPGPMRLGAGRQLQLSWRRNAVLSITFTIAVVTSIAMAGVSSSIKDDVGASVDRWTQSELVVQAAGVGENLQNEKFPLSLGQELGAVDGVDGVTPFTYAYVTLDGKKTQVWNWPSDHKLSTDLEVAEGEEDFLTALGPDEIAISSNFARTQDMEVGDTFDMPLPSGQRALRVRTIVEDSASDGGMLIASTALYRELAATDGVYEYFVGVREGANVSEVAAALEDTVAERYPRAKVRTQEDVRDAFGGITARLVSAFEAFAWVMFLLAVMVGGATLASGLVERQRGLALTRLVGATRKSVSRQLTAETLLIAVSSWVVALPVGLLAIPAMLDAQAGQSGLLPPVTVPLLLTVASLPLVALCMLLALWVAGPRRANPPLRELLAQE
ncbi:ABC transporter permease [Streptomyces sp. NBC_01808]|uniref:ABC transporter permease n=1 Tax=Streptomyces sp. NBC_01808 TaxID=2975947 RepID=UPI002DDBE1E9|nr:FtsX-like permease family protein [Streptomyces sp. NBC_01808]WSA39840.1 ABC transporter permease [Streptomyces sp. NBC_01808]